MKILAVTGKLAEKDVRRSSGDRADVLVIDEEIAAFITPSKLKKHLNIFSDYDVVLLPGLARGDFKKLEEETGTKIRLGPIHATDLGLILEKIEQIELSHSVPACRLLERKMGEKTIHTFEKIKNSSHIFFSLGNVLIKREPPVVISEIVNALELEKDELIAHADYCRSQGAEIIDVGVPVDADPKDAGKAVGTLVKEGFTVSIDSHDPDVIKEALKNGAILVLSITEKNIDIAEEIAKKDAGAVVLSSDKKISSLYNLVEKVREAGVEKILADPILDPPVLGFSQSIARYAEFRKKYPNIPVLLGAGNVTELIDADSPGINAIIATIALELEVNAILTTEFSHKTRGSIKELKKGIIMATVAKERNSPPKDLGISLLILKEKSRIPEGELPETYVRATPSNKFMRDPMGDFRIWIAKEKIVASHERLNVVGKDAKSIIDTILAHGLVSRLDHAGYLGRELMKAQIALKLGRSYLQDDEF